MFNHSLFLSPTLYVSLSCLINTLSHLRVFGVHSSCPPVEDVHAALSVILQRSSHCHVPDPILVQVCQAGQRRAEPPPLTLHPQHGHTSVRHHTVEVLHGDKPAEIHR